MHRPRTQEGLIKLHRKSAPVRDKEPRQQRGIIGREVLVTGRVDRGSKPAWGIGGYCLGLYLRATCTEYQKYPLPLEVSTVVELPRVGRRGRKLKPSPHGDEIPRMQWR